ncbi:MAG TPA: hypothetical protein VL651_08220, partial [Bacteroidia bacterium]|nr:hypothetical protein [Bacteroidia bacterium]
MKRYLKSIALLFLFAAGVPKLHAQVMPKSFTDDPVKFIQEMSDFFESYDRKDGKDFIDEFNKNYWENGKITNDIKQLCYKNANEMLKKKFRPSPEYYSYFNTIKTIVDNAVPQTTINAWQSCFENLAAGKLAKPFSDFIAMSENLFAGNRFFKTASGEWWTEGGSWKFNCDSVSSIEFTGVTLKALAKHDSTKITNTSGTYYPGTGIWKGTGGRVTWERAGLKAEEQYADLKTYSITIKSFSYTADSVTFYSKNYFQGKPLPGKITEKLVADAQVATAQFPQFESYSSRYLIKNIYPNVDFEGGFKQVGAKFVGSGTKDQPAYFRFKRNGIDFLTVSSTGFSITPQKVTSTNAKIKFAFGTDSIVHPYIDFKYFVDSSKVLLYRSEEGASQAPFYDSFHQVDMYIQQISWVTTDQTILINTLPGSTFAEATFPSTTYYRQYLYDQLQGIEPVHPLIKIRNFVRDNNAGVKTFSVTDLSHYWKIGPEQLRPLMVNLSNQGFIIYDPNTDMITYLDKCDTYIAARAGKKDYDNIIFESKVTPGLPNAKINLLNYDMTLFGVKEVALSDSQNVTVFPDQDMLILKKDRNFTFQGSIMAGRFDYYGKLFSFDYKTFTLDLNNVDSVRIWIDTDKHDPQDPKGGFIQMKVKSVIENLNGKLQVDDPANKSGVWTKKYPQYPIFTSSKPAFVYYDKPGIQKGVYNRDKFYFKLDPFTIDSLDNFQNSSLRFAGTFASSGILPDIKDTIRLMPDYSLGFTRIAPAGGYPLYGGKAKFTNEIRLSNQGLRGDGTINYITSTSISKDFIFFPDSMNGVAQSFAMAEQMISGKTEYPQATDSNVYIHWMPKKDYMNATNKDSLFKMMNGNAKFDGTLTLSPKKLQGNGEMDFSTAQLFSKDMVFKQHIVDADTSNFNLKAIAQAGLALKTDNVKAHIDFVKREGDFEALADGTLLTFPVNQYICFMKNFKWYMDQGSLEMSGGKKGTGGVNLEGPEFISIHPKQDSLRFQSPKAVFDYRNNIIYAKEVPEIDVADAKIVPDSGNVVIRAEANMQTLTNAQITANTVTQYHKLFNCVVNVSSRHDYQASGDYAYVDELKK